MNGFAVRAGSLLAVGDGPAEPVSALVHRVAAEGGDGAELVRRASAGAPLGGATLALGGLTGAGATVLVRGGATADLAGVRITGPEQTARSVPGPVGELRLAWPDAGLTVAVTPAAVSPPAPVVRPRRADRSAPFESVLLIPGAAPQPVAGQPVAGQSVAGQPVAGQPVAEQIDADAVTRPLVEGVFCKNGHFNDPAVQYCQRCGISMAQLTQVSRLGPRPPLGLLLLDNGTTLRLDTDYVVGREPETDPDVAAGRARAVRMLGSTGVSRRHVRVTLDGWAVRVLDLRSANGTYVHVPGEPAPLRLPPGVPAVIRPGTRVDLGRRWLRYESHRNP